MALSIDDAVGGIVDELRGRRMWAETMLVFLSDNGAVPGTEGGGANWPLRGGKFTAYEGGVRVPAFVHGPKYWQSRWQSARYPALVHVTDITPTLLDVAGLLGADDGFDGVSHASALFVGGELLQLRGSAAAADGSLMRGISFVCILRTSTTRVSKIDTTIWRDRSQPPREGGGRRARTASERAVSHSTQTVACELGEGPLAMRAGG